MGKQSDAEKMFQTMVQSSGKLVLTDKLLPKLKADGHKVLVFSQFTSFLALVRDRLDTAKITFSVPAERRIKQTVLEVRYSPTLAGAMIDALPYMVDYPYGCTEQTLNRFLPTVITQRLLLNMKLNM